MSSQRGAHEPAVRGPEGRRSSPAGWQLLALVTTAVSLLALVSGAYSLATAERTWPSIRAYEANLAYGPVGPGGAFEQTFRAPPSPVRRLQTWVARDFAGTPVAVRLYVQHDGAEQLVFESRATADASGQISVTLPRNVVTGDAVFILRVVNQSDHARSIIAQANRTNPYAFGRAAIHGDPSTGLTDLRFQVGRRITPRLALAESLRAASAGRIFLGASALVAVLVFAWMARATARRLNDRLWAFTIAIASLAALAWLLRLGFDALAPWGLQ